MRNGAFVSYCHADAEYLTRLQVHLAPYIREKKVDLWDDTRITPGGQWKEEINQAIALARVAILLVSADFMASEFIAQNELLPLLERAKQQGMLVVPVILSSCSFMSSELACYQSFNNPSFPLTRMSLGEQEAIWAKLAKYVVDALPPVQINPQLGLGKRPEMSTNTRPIDKSSHTQSMLDKAILGGQSAPSSELIIDSLPPTPEKDAEEVQTQSGATPFASSDRQQKHTKPAPPAPTDHLSFYQRTKAPSRMRIMSPSHVIIAILILALTVVSVRAFLFSPLSTLPNRGGGNPNTHSSGGSSQDTPTDLVSPSPTSSPIQLGTVLCNYHWTNGMDGWSGNANWKQVNNMLVDDGTDPNGGFQDSVALAPCQHTTDNYSIEATIQYVKNGGGSASWGGQGTKTVALGTRRGSLLVPSRHTTIWRQLLAPANPQSMILRILLNLSHLKTTTR